VRAGRLAGALAGNEDTNSSAPSATSPMLQATTMLSPTAFPPMTAAAVSASAYSTTTGV